MFNFNRCAVEELHPMEIALLGTGDVTLNAVAAEYKMLSDLGYIAMENEAFVKGRPLRRPASRGTPVCIWPCAACPGPSPALRPCCSKSTG